MIAAVSVLGRILSILALISLFWIDAVKAQAILKSIQQGGSDAALRAAKTRGPSASLPMRFRKA
jgi:hypothetical protein